MCKEDVMDDKGFWALKKSTGRLRRRFFVNFIEKNMCLTRKMNSRFPKIPYVPTYKKISQYLPTTDTWHIIIITEFENYCMM